MKDVDAINRIRESCCYKLSAKYNLDIAHYILSQNVQWLDIATDFPVFNILNLLKIKYKVYEDLWIAPGNSSKKLVKVKSINGNSPILELARSSQIYYIDFADKQYTSLLIKKPPFKENSDNILLRHNNTIYLRLGSGFKVDSQIDCETMILDLRDNMGGKLSALKHLIGQFASRETCICELRNREHTYALSTLPEHNIRFEKLIVLTNSRTASCSEILVNWLRESYNATVYGHTTLGKWVATSISRFGKYYIKIPNYFITFRGKSYFRGIEPDVYSNPSDIDSLLNENGISIPTDDDLKQKAVLCSGT